mmetsp:Transcript_28036/g.94121  ORF Transcript_28036/g.94121 Transcript_28036/m.94121 type:complete len:230 (+) Transcript_28036:1743-2432(+)
MRQRGQLHCWQRNLLGRRSLFLSAGAEGRLVRGGRRIVCVGSCQGQTHHGAGVRVGCALPLRLLGLRAAAAAAEAPQGHHQGRGARLCALGARTGVGSQPEPAVEGRDAAPLRLAPSHAGQAEAEGQQGAGHLCDGAAGWAVPRLPLPRVVERAGPGKGAQGAAAAVCPKHLALLGRGQPGRHRAAGGACGQLGGRDRAADGLDRRRRRRTRLRLHALPQLLARAARRG